MAENIRWGIIGPGKIAHKFAQDLLLVEGAVLQGVASRDGEKAREFGQQYGAVECFDSYEALVANPQIDVVYVATPHVFHFEHSMICLEHGKHVLCEKPFGMNAYQVQLMTEKAREQGLFLMEALWSRFIPSVGKVLELIGQDVVGTIEYVRADFGFLGDTHPQKRVYNKALGGGSLLDVGIYPVFLSLLLQGEPSKIKAMASFSESEVDTVCAMLFDFENGQKAVLESGIIANTPMEAYVYGSNGFIKMHPRFHHSQRLSLCLNGQEEQILDVPYLGNGYFHEIEEVMQCLRSGEKESVKMPHAFSVSLIGLLDRIRKEIGLWYPQDRD